MKCKGAPVLHFQTAREFNEEEKVVSLRQQAWMTCLGRRTYHKFPMFSQVLVAFERTVL